MPPEEVLYALPETPTSVFVIVPKSNGGKEFVTVIDKDRERSRKKLPGGGASIDRAISSSGQAEVFEETGLNIDPPTRKILEVHEVDEKTGLPYHWVAMLAMPPVSSIRLSRKKEELAAAPEELRAAIKRDIEDIRHEWPLEPGDEIAEAHWETVDDILKGVAEAKFFRNHRNAFKWYLSGGSDQVRRDILKDRGVISWFIDDDGCLVSCRDQNCQVCDREELAVDETVREKPEETMEMMERLYPKHFPKKSRLLSGNTHQFEGIRPKAVTPEKQVLSGKVEVMFVSMISGEDWLYLERDHNYGERYPNAVKPHVVTLDKPTTAAELAKLFGVIAKKQITISNRGRTVALIAGKKTPNFMGRVTFSLNSPPPYDMIATFEQSKIVLEAVERYNRIFAEETIWLHNSWLGLPGIARRREEASRGRVESAIAG